MQLDLDRAVLSNAYVSGMREDIGLTGNEYNLLVTCLAGKLMHLSVSIHIPSPKVLTVSQLVVSISVSRPGAPVKAKEK